MKRFIAFFLIVFITTSTVFASVEMDLSLGGQSNGSISISDSTTFDFLVESELDMDFNRGHGMLIGILLSKQDIGINVGYAYQTDISSSCDFILGAGATIMISNSNVGLNYFVTTDFDFNITQDMFIRIGTGVILELGNLGRDYGKEWKITIPLPALAFGWHF